MVGLEADDGQLLGFASYGTFRAWPAYKYSVEHSVYVHKDHRGKGLGRNLMQRLIQEAKAQEYHVMVGGIDVTNMGSIALHESLGKAVPMRRRVLRSFLSGCTVVLTGLGIGDSPLAQTSGVPRNGFYVGVGGSYNSMNFGTQDLYAIGTSNVYQNGTLVATGYAAGPGTVNMPSESKFAPSVQAGYFQHFANSAWLWGAKFSYSYLNTTSTVDNIVLPQYGSFTELASNTTIPFIGNAVARSYATNLEHQLALMPFIGRSFEKGFVYVGGGLTWSRTRTNINGLVGFADLEGHHTDVSGAPVDFAASGWVSGGAGVIGGTYFLDPSWFLDFAYTYARTKSQTFDYSSAFNNANGPFGTTAGTLVGSSSGKVITQGVTLTLNKAF